MREHLRALAKDTLVYGVSVVLSRSLAFLLIPLYTRSLSPEDFGAATLITAVMLVTSLILIGGLDLATIRWFWASDGEDERRRIVATACWLQIGAGLAATALFLVGGEVVSWVLFGHTGYSTEVRLAAAALAPTAATNGIRVLLRTRQQPVLMLIVNVALAATTLAAAAVFLLVFDLGVAGLFLATAAGAAVAALLGLGLARSWLDPRRFSKAAAAEMLRFGLPTVPGAIAIWVVDLSDRFFVRAFASNAEVAKYQVASTIAAVTSLAVAAFEQAWGPYALSIQQRPDARQVYTRVMALYVGLVGLVALLISIFSSVVIRLVAPPEYASSPVVVTFLAFAYLATGIRVIANTGALIAGSQVGVTLSLIGAALLNVALNIALIPWLGITGAAISTLVAQAVSIVYTFAASQRLHRVPYRLREAAILTLAGLGFALLRDEIHGSRLQVALLDAALVVLFLALAFVCGAVPLKALLSSIARAVRRNAEPPTPSPTAE